MLGDDLVLEGGLTLKKKIFRIKLILEKIKIEKG